MHKTKNGGTLLAEDVHDKSSLGSSLGRRTTLKWSTSLANKRETFYDSRGRPTQVIHMLDTEHQAG